MGAEAIVRILIAGLAELATAAPKVFAAFAGGRSLDELKDDADKAIADQKSAESEWGAELDSFKRGDEPTQQ